MPEAVIAQLALARASPDTLAILVNDRFVRTIVAIEEFV